MGDNEITSSEEVMSDQLRKFENSLMHFSRTRTRVVGCLTDLNVNTESLTPDEAQTNADLKAEGRRILKEIDEMIWDIRHTIKEYKGAMNKR